MEQDSPMYCIFDMDVVPSSNQMGKFMRGAYETLTEAQAAFADLYAEYGIPLKDNDFLFIFEMKEVPNGLG